MRLRLATNNQATRRKEYKKLPSAFKQQPICTPLATTKNKIIYKTICSNFFSVLRLLGSRQVVTQCLSYLNELCNVLYVPSLGSKKRAWTSTQSPPNKTACSDGSNSFPLLLTYGVVKVYAILGPAWNHQKRKKKTRKKTKKNEKNSRFFTCFGFFKNLLRGGPGTTKDGKKRKKMKKTKKNEKNSRFFLRFWIFQKWAKNQPFWWPPRFFDPNEGTYRTLHNSFNGTNTVSRPGESREGEGREKKCSDGSNSGSGKLSYLEQVLRQARKTGGGQTVRSDNQDDTDENKRRRQTSPLT